MLKAAKNGDNRRFLRYSEFIYGKPEKEIYEYTLFQVKKWVDRKLFDSDPDISSAASRLNRDLFDALMNNDNSIDLDKYEIPKPLKQEDEREYTSDEIKIVFEEALVNYQLEGWRVVINKNGKYKAINVGQEEKEIRIPERRSLKHTNLKALIEHEIGTHARRRENGERTKLKLLGLGLDRSLRGEEGVATYKEQEIKGANEFAGFAGHFAISLALGMDGKKETSGKYLKF